MPSGKPLIDSMKQTFILLFFTLIANSLLACLSASQNRLFPLGQTSKGLCVVETHLYRTEFRVHGKEVNDVKPAWGGVSYLKIYDQNYTEIYSSILDSITLFEQDHYDSIVGKSFSKGLELAKTYSDFVAAKPHSITFCDYQKSCSKAELVFDSINTTISVQLSNSIKYGVNVLYDTTSIASNFLEYYGSFDDAPAAVRSFKERLYVNSIRQFQIGDKTLTIVHIGSGQMLELVAEGGTYPPGKEYEAEFEFADISKSVFEEPVLHHGHGFDFFIWH